MNDILFRALNEKRKQMNDITRFRTRLDNIYDGARIIVFCLDEPADVEYEGIVHASTRNFLPKIVKSIINNPDTYMFETDEDTTSYDYVFVGWE